MKKLLIGETVRYFKHDLSEAYIVSYIIMMDWIVTYTSNGILLDVMSIMISQDKLAKAKQRKDRTCWLASLV